MTLSDLILELGGPFAASVKMKVSQRMVQKWLSGHHLPSGERLVKLYYLSGGVLDFNAVFLSYMKTTKGNKKGLSFVKSIRKIKKSNAKK